MDGVNEGTVGTIRRRSIAVLIGALLALPVPAQEVAPLAPDGHSTLR